MTGRRPTFTLSLEMTNDPVLIAYAVKRSTRGHPVWTRIGRAYPHDQGAGLTVILDSMPRDGRIVLLEPDQRDDERLLREAALIGQAAGRPGKAGRGRPAAPEK